MPNFSDITIRQYSPGSVGGYVADRDFNWSSEGDCRDSLLGVSTEIGVQFYYAYQHPRPMFVSLPYSVSEDWSDSPSNAPFLSDLERYSYGRFGPNRYGKLDNYRGASVRQNYFGMASESLITELITSKDTVIYDIDTGLTNETLVYETEVPFNYTTLNQRNLLLNASPAPFSYKNPVDTDVYIRMGNYVYTLSSGTITLSLDGESKTGLEITPYFGGLGGYDVTWSNDQEFGYNSRVAVHWTVYDSYVPPNKIDFDYWFMTVQDYLGPRFFSFSPQDGDIGVGVDTCISFVVRDYELGINISSLELYVNNVFIPISSMSISETSSGDGYSISFCPPEEFLYGDTIPVSIYVEDNSEEKNYSFYVYSFTTEESLAPNVISQDPRSCIGYVPVDYDVEVDVVDGGGGIDGESIVLIIDSKPAVFRKEPIIYRED